MTDKFVVSTNEIGEIIVTDVETDRVYRYDSPSNFFGLIRLLNEQQAIIRKLQDLCGESDSENAKLRIENEQLRRLFVEMKQPITINLTEEDEKELRKLLGLIDEE